MNEYQLESEWELWYHSIKDDNWKINSYKKIYKIDNLINLKITLDTFTKLSLQDWSNELVFFTYMYLLYARLFGRVVLRRRPAIIYYY